MTLNLGSVLDNSRQQIGQETAVIFGDTKMTYEELDAAVRRFAQVLLDAGIQKGDRVALMAPNVPEFSIAYFGILYAGATAVTLNSLLSADEVKFQLTDCEARGLVLHSAFVPDGVTQLSPLYNLQRVIPGVMIIQSTFWIYANSSVLSSSSCWCKSFSDFPEILE